MAFNKTDARVQVFSESSRQLVLAFPILSQTKSIPLWVVLSAQKIPGYMGNLVFGVRPSFFGYSLATKKVTCQASEAGW